MSETNNKEGIMSLFQSKIMALISINLFFQWYFFYLITIFIICLIKARTKSCFLWNFTKYRYADIGEIL
jgi:hypothetical protein